MAGVQVVKVLKTSFNCKRSVAVFTPNFTIFKVWHTCTEDRVLAVLLLFNLQFILTAFQVRHGNKRQRVPVQ